MKFTIYRTCVGDYDWSAPVDYPGVRAVTGDRVTKCSVPNCSCGGLADERDTHDTGLRLGPPGLSIPVFVSPYVSDWTLVSGDWQIHG